MIKNIYIIIGSLIILSGLGVFTVHEEIFVPNSEARSLLAEGKLLLEQESEEGMKRAVETFTVLASHFPDTEQAKQALYHLAESYEKLGNVDVAIGKYRRLLGLDLDEDMIDKVRYKIARLQMMRHNAEEGVNSMMMLLSKKIEPSLRSDIYTEIARFHADRNEFEKSLTNYEIALSEYPRNVNANIEIGDIYFQQGKYYEALSQYKKVYRVFIDRNAREETIVKKYIQNVFEKGIRIFRKEKYKEAEGYFEFIYTRFPKTAEAEESLYYHGNVHYGDRNYEKAISLFRQVIELAPATRDENAFIKTGQCFYQLGDYKKSAILFAKAQELFPNGRYNKIASQWEDEARKALQESYTYEAEKSKTGTQTQQAKKETNDSKTTEKLPTEELKPDKLPEEKKVRKSPTVKDNKIDFFRPNYNEPDLDGGTVVP
ncbi:MAG: tetratricopeptide repeat protein [Leptospirales bacterium]